MQSITITSKEPMKKIQKITGVAAVGAALVPVSHGAIVQSDLPGGGLRSGPGISNNWDVDGDGTSDFSLFVAGAGSDSFLFFGFSNDNNAVVGPGFGKLDAGFTVGSTADFNRGAGNRLAVVATAGFLPGDAFNGGWINNFDNGYIGFRFDIAGGTHYGWAEVTIDSNQAIINEAWYEDVAGASINVAVPEVSQFSLGLGALAMGAAGLRRMRRQIA